MDQRIFDQLDQLQRGARELVPRQSAYNNSSAGYSGYGGASASNDEHGGYFDEGERFADENIDPMAYSGKCTQQSSVSLQRTDQFAGAQGRIPRTAGYPQGHRDMTDTQGTSWPPRMEVDRHVGNNASNTRPFDLCKSFPRWWKVACPLLTDSSSLRPR